MVKKISAHVLQCIDVAMFAGGHCKGRVISGSNFYFQQTVSVRAHFRECTFAGAEICVQSSAEMCEQMCDREKSVTISHICNPAGAEKCLQCAYGCAQKSWHN